jgi:4-amino-4-deoxy-L-arabinose transferase-like glycosyltransferase
MSRRTTSLLFLILIAGAALRIAVNDVEEYSPYDEAVYVRTTAFLSQHGWTSYPALVRDYLANRETWLYPHPMRWGHFALTTLACTLSTKCDARTLADLSTVAGILSILLTFLLGRELLGAEVALIAAALTVTSPLQLAMGRRALQDEVFCASVLLTLWLCALVVRSTKATSRRRLLLTTASVAAMTMTLAVKESSVLLYPALLLFLFALAPSPRSQALPGIAALFVLPPLFHAAVTIALCGGLKTYFNLLNIVMTTASSINSPFARQYSSGPFHRPLFDLVILSPLVMVLAIAGASRSGRDRALNALSLFAAATLIVFGLLTLKNVRYVIPVDPVARLLAASVLATLPRRPLLVLGAIGVIATTELRLFYALFEMANIYDPLTESLLRALNAIPHAPPE